MPIYEFVCKKCGLEFEVIRKVDDFTANCPVCAAEAEKKMSAVGFVVNGSTNVSVDKIIGADAERKWMAIKDRKQQRDRQLGSSTDGELKVKDQQRVVGLLDRQRNAFTAIERVKRERGVTKKEELDHVLKG